MTSRIDFTVTEEELAQLEKAIKQSPHPKVRQRATAIRLLHHGMTPDEAADVVQVSANTVYAWHQRWRDEGVDGLKDKPRSGRPTTRKTSEEVTKKETLETVQQADDIDTDDVAVAATIVAPAPTEENISETVTVDEAVPVVTTETKRSRNPIKAVSKRAGQVSRGLRSLTRKPAPLKDDGDIQLLAELSYVLKTIFRWSPLIVVIVGAVVGLLFMSSRNEEDVFETQVFIRVTTPDSSEIGVEDANDSITDRDEISITINKFLVTSQYDVVFERTREQLNLPDDVTYTVSPDSNLGSDFIQLIFSAPEAQMVHDIANAHAANSIEYFGELHALPIQAALSYFDEQIDLSSAEIARAEKDLLSFQAKHGFTSIRDEISIQRGVIENLEVSKARFDFDRILNPSSGNSSSVLDELLLESSTVALEPDLIDQLLAEYRQNMLRLATLEPQYNTLIDRLNAVRNEYELLTDRYARTELQLSFARSVFFLQVSQDAWVPRSPANSPTRTLIFGGIGSMGFAILVVFFIEYWLSARNKSREEKAAA